jgi:hypothetical protein
VTDGPLAVRWVWAFVDLPPEGFERGARFWAEVARSTPSPRRGEHEQFLTLLPEQGAPWVKLQRVGGQGGVHVDLDVEGSLQAARDHAVGLGASVVDELDDVVVCRSPGGFVFCLTRYDADETGGGQVRDGAPSLVDQVCLDIPSGRWDDELRFWADLTGWSLTKGAARDEQDEFDRLEWPQGLPVRFLLQRLDDEDGPVRGHLDLSGADPEAEIARHVALGATRVGPGRGWTVMQDPTGAVYCVTERHPDRARQT